MISDSAINGGLSVNLASCCDRCPSLEETSLNWKNTNFKYFDYYAWGKI
jgi:hypothetical protein